MKWIMKLLKYRRLLKKYERNDDKMMNDLHLIRMSYVIFDDDTDMLAEQLDNFIQTDEVYGITLKDAERAISILNKEQRATILKI